MDNKIEHFFVLKPDGKIYWVDTMPDSYFYVNNAHGWRAATLSAIDNAVEVSNFDETEDALLDAHATDHGFRLEVGKVYSLQCRVEKEKDHIQGWTKETGYTNPKVTALVTFSQPEREETQEQIFDDLFCQYLDCIYNKEMSGYTANIEIQRRFTITRKTP